MGKHKPGKGRATKKARAGMEITGEASEGPATFVFHRGKVSKNVQQLVRDMRCLMEPYTASRLKVRQNNVIKDFVSAAGIFNVSHLVAFTQTKSSIYMKLVRLPRGPTITFRISSYSLSRDVMAVLKDPHMDPKQFLYHPLVVLNNFSGEGMEFRLMATMFQNMFPSINVGKVNLNHLRRCFVLNYNAEDKTIDFTQCNIQVTPVGISKPIKKLLKAKVPDMSKYSDISDYVTKDGNMSDGEAELDGPANEVTLPQKMSGRGNIELAKSAIKMNEIGPRITMTLHKIEEGICEGEVLYHDLFHKTEDEIKKLKDEKEMKRKLKEQRKKQQDENIKHKSAVKEQVKKEDSDVESNNKSQSESEDDEKYFKEEVGVARDSELISKTTKRKARSSLRSTLHKRVKRVQLEDRNETHAGKGAYLSKYKEKRKKNLEKTKRNNQ